MRRKRRKRKECTPIIRLKRENWLGLGLSVKDAGRDTSWLIMETAILVATADSHATKPGPEPKNKTP